MLKRLLRRLLRQWRYSVATPAGFSVPGVLAGVVLLIVAVVLFAGAYTWIGLLLIVLAILAVIFL